MGNGRPCLWLFAAVWRLALASGVAAAADPGEMARALERARAPEHAEEWLELTQAARDGNAPELDPAGRAALDREIATAFAPERLLTAIREGLGSAAEPARLAAFLAWYEEPFGARVAASGGSVYLDPERLREIPDFAMRLFFGDFSGSRWQALRGLDAATGTTRDVLAVAQAIGAAETRGAAELVCLGPRRSERLVADTAQRIERLRPEVEARVAGKLALVYADLSDAELARLARFARSSDASWLYAGIGRELGLALAASEASLGRALAPQIAARCGSG